VLKADAVLHRFLVEATKIMPFPVQEHVLNSYYKHLRADANWYAGHRMSSDIKSHEKVIM